MGSISTAFGMNYFVTITRKENFITNFSWQYSFYKFSMRFYNLTTKDC